MKSDVKSKQQLLIDCAADNDVNAAKKLLEDKNVDVNGRVWLSWTKGYSDTALQTAVRNNRVEIATLLLDNGADKSIATYLKCNSLLHIAAQNGNVDLCRLLKERGIDPNIRNQLGRTPLMLAVWSGETEAAEVLISEGALINIGDTFLDTPLTFAKEGSEVEKFLLRKGASRMPDEDPLDTYLGV